MVRSLLYKNPRYLNHNVNGRCDDLIDVLLRMDVDMFYDRKRKEIISSRGGSRNVKGGIRVANVFDMRRNVGT